MGIHTSQVNYLHSWCLLDGLREHQLFYTTLAIQFDLCFPQQSLQRLLVIFLHSDYQTFTRPGAVHSNTQEAERQ